jgi:hypothetical protein
LIKAAAAGQADQRMLGFRNKSKAFYRAKRLTSKPLQAS